MRVAVIVPPWRYWTDPARIQPLYELGFATLIDARLGSENVVVDIIDLRGHEPRQWIAMTPERDLYLYWIMKSGDHNDVRTVVDQLRTLYPKAQHVAGGTHVAITEETRRECVTIFDSIVLGPGEESFLNAIRDRRDGGVKPVYETDFVKVRYGDYPWPLRHYLPEDRIVKTDLFATHPGLRGTCVQFSRGCPFSCDFCVYNVPNTLRMRPPEKMAEEIEYLKKEYGIQALNLKDEICIPLSRKVAVPFIETLGRANVKWRGQTVVNSNKEMVALAAEAGCVELAFGVESASQQVLDINCRSKGLKIEGAKEMIGYCKSLGIRVKVCLIFGLPGEPRDIVEITTKFLDETQPDYVSLSTFCPFPGSKIARDPEKYGIKFISSNWNQYSHLLYRYSDEEDFEGLPFEYAESSPWGEPFTRAEILENVRQVQHYVRERKMLY